MKYVTRSVLGDVLDAIDAGFGSEAGGTVYLVGETSLVWENVRSWTDEVELSIRLKTGEQASIVDELEKISQDLGIAIIDEFPGDVIPLPEGWIERCRQIDGGSALRRSHFDPYSVSFRFIARGDEEDYRLVLTYLENGWLSLEKMDDLLAGLLPHFSFETISQDPAEFRRRYQGLKQMWRSRT